MTLDIMRMVITDQDIQHFLFLGSYRDNEVSGSHPLSVKLLSAIQEQGIKVVPIKVGPVNVGVCNTLLSELLCLPQSLVRPLATVVHKKTGGIIMFIIRLLSSLNDKGDLRYSFNDRRWTYDLEEISVKEVYDDVVSLMTDNMKNLSPKMMFGLKVAACLGSKFNAQVIDKIKKDDEIEDTFLQECINLGFLRMSGDTCVWQHDQIQQAAYDLIPSSNRDSFHLMIGSRLFMATSASEMKNLLFSIVDNMNLGQSLITEQERKDELAELNLDAGEKALRQSAFESCSKYILTGLSLLGQDSWKTKYDLTLKLHEAASEALFVTGDHAQLLQLTSAPLAKARSFEDKLNIYNNLVRSLAGKFVFLNHVQVCLNQILLVVDSIWTYPNSSLIASAQYDEGIKACAGILSQLGEVIPTDVSAEFYATELNGILSFLNGKTREELVTLPMMTDIRKLVRACTILSMFTSTYDTPSPDILP